MFPPAAARAVDPDRTTIRADTSEGCREVPPSVARWSLMLAVALPVAGTGAPAATPPDGPAAGIRRCVTSGGTVVYTDAACAWFDARSTPLPDDVLARIATAQAPGALAAAALPGGDGVAATRLPLPGTGRRPPAAGCARTPRQLSRDLIDSFALRDVNRVAESYHWAGLSQSRSLPVMRRLERLAAQPLADARYLAAWIGPAHAAPDPGIAGLMQLVFAGSEAMVLDLAVRRHSGCYFVAF